MRHPLEDPGIIEPFVVLAQGEQQVNVRHEARFWWNANGQLMVQTANHSGDVHTCMPGKALTVEDVRSLIAWLQRTMPQ